MSSPAPPKRPPRQCVAPSACAITTFVLSKAAIAAASGRIATVWPSADTL